LRLSLAQYRELEAFSQFGSDLDKATQAQLNRGRRLVEILKQGQYAPLSAAKQILIIFAATSGYLDDLPVEQCGDFERELYRYFDATHKNLLDAIREKSGVTDELRASLRKALDDFKDQFKATRGAPAIAAAR
jgi:F-type H+-transporting ATPase subunit alpha